MEQYKIRPEGIWQIRNQSLRQSVPLLLVAVATGCFMSYPNFNSTVMLLFVPLMIGVVFFSIRKGAARLEQLFGSYTLAIDEDSILREQFNTPSVKIPFNSISAIEKNMAGGFTISGAKPADKILIPAQIERIEELEKSLHGIKNISLQASPSFFDKYRILLTLINLASMVIIFMVSNKMAVALAGVCILGLTGWSAFTVFQSKNIDRKTKRSMYWVIPVLLAVLFTVYYKLSH